MGVQVLPGRPKITMKQPIDTRISNSIHRYFDHLFDRIMESPFFLRYVYFMIAILSLILLIGIPIVAIAVLTWIIALYFHPVIVSLIAIFAFITLLFLLYEVVSRD